VLVGADGYRSLVRSHPSASTRSDDAGYVVWRGNYPEERLVQRAVVDRGDEERAWFTVCFEGGNAIVYVVPGADGRAAHSHPRSRAVAAASVRLRAPSLAIAEER
jgi:hypothetical protein